MIVTGFSKKGKKTFLTPLIYFKALRFNKHRLTPLGKYAPAIFSVYICGKIMKESIV